MMVKTHKKMRNTMKQTNRVCEIDSDDKKHMQDIIDKHFFQHSGVKVYYCTHY